MYFGIIIFLRGNHDKHWVGQLFYLFFCLLFTFLPPVVALSFFLPQILYQPPSHSSKSQADKHQTLFSGVSRQTPGTCQWSCQALMRVALSVPGCTALANYLSSGSQREAQRWASLYFCGDAMPHFQLS